MKSTAKMGENGYENGWEGWGNGVKMAALRMRDGVKKGMKKRWEGRPFAMAFPPMVVNDGGFCGLGAVRIRVL